MYVSIIISSHADDECKPGSSPKGRRSEEDVSTTESIRKRIKFRFEQTSRGREQCKGK